MTAIPSRAARVPALLGAILLAAVLGTGATLLEGRLLPSIDPRPAIAGAFRSGALSIDPVEDRWIGPRRGLDCAWLQSTLPADVAGFGLRSYSDPRGLAADCEVLRDLAVRDPLAVYEPGLETTDVALGRGAMAWLLTQTSMPILRWMIGAAWLAVAAVGLMTVWRTRAAAIATDDRSEFPASLLLGPLLAGAGLWLIGPSLSMAMPFALLIALASWAGAARLRAAVLPAALFGLALALTEYRAPMAICGLAVLTAILLRRVGLRFASLPILAYGFGAVAAIVGHDALAAWSSDASIGALAEALVDRLDPARDPLQLEAIVPAMIDTLETLLPGPRSAALGVFWALGFGLLFAPALMRASQRHPMPIGRAYAGLAALLPVAVWVAWFGGRSALGAAEGGVIYASLMAMAGAALLQWLAALAMIGRQAHAPATA